MKHKKRPLWFWMRWLGFGGLTPYLLAHAELPFWPIAIGFAVWGAGLAGSLVMYWTNDYITELEEAKNRLINENWALRRSLIEDPGPIFLKSRLANEKQLGTELRLK